MSGPRPARLWLVAGTGTDVGKTWAGCELARLASARGLKVAARKTAQSFAPGELGLDAQRLGEATGESPGRVCPEHRWYPVAMAPPLAAAALGMAPFGLAQLLAEVDWPSPGVDVGLVEQAGGTGSPQASDGDGVDMARLLAPDAVVLVARSGLGTLSDVSLARRALAGEAGIGPERLVVLLNRFDPGDALQAANRDWLSGVLGLQVATGTDGLLEALLQ